MQRQLLGDRYTVTTLLGRGGMGEVWEAWDAELERTVAVKLLTSPPAGLADDPSDDPRGGRPLRREARAVARLTHPNIAAVHDVGRAADGRDFLVMELVHGASVRELLAGGPLPWPTVADIGAQTAHALAAAHRAQVVHCDVKPSNLLVTEDHVVKVVDFGVAATGPTSTSDGSPVAGRVELVGTAAYTAPERALGHPPRPAADLYSLGCVLYEALTGQPPFAGDAPTSVLHRHVRELPTPLGQLRPDVPKEFATLVDRLLAKNPDDRPDSAAATAALLAGIAGTAPAEHAAGMDPGATQLLPPTPTAAAEDPPTALLQPATEDEHVPHPEGRRDRRGLMLAAGLVGALLAVGLVIGLLVAVDTGGGSEAPEAQATTGAPTSPGPSLPASPGTATASDTAAPSAAASPTTTSPTPTTSASTSAPATTTPPVTPPADLAADLNAAYTTASADMQPNLARTTRSDVNAIVANLRSGEEDKAAARARDLSGRLVEAQQKGRWDGDAAFLQLLGRIAAG